MKEIIKSILKKIDLINESYISLNDFIDSENCFDNFETEKMERLKNQINKLDKYNNDYNQLYPLLQSFHYSVSNYDSIFLEEIELKWLNILINWFELKSKTPKNDWDIDNISSDDLDFNENCMEQLRESADTIEKILICDTKGLNRFSLKYMNNKQKNLISFSDYHFLYDIKNEYNQRKKRLNEIEHYGEEALNTSDRRKMRINELKLEDYVQYLETKSEDFYSFKSFKSIKSDFIEENRSSIISKPFKFNFVKSVDYINSRTSQKDFYVEQTFAYLIDHREYFGIGMDKTDFEYLIINKKLPSGMNKVLWKGTPTDALILCKLFNIELSRFNRCFNLSNGKPLKSNSAGKNPQTDFAKFTRNLKLEFDSPI